MNLQIRNEDTELDFTVKSGEVSGELVITSEEERGTVNLWKGTLSSLTSSRELVRLTHKCFRIEIQEGLGRINVKIWRQYWPWKPISEIHLILRESLQPRFLLATRGSWDTEFPS